MYHSLMKNKKWKLVEVEVEDALRKQYESNVILFLEENNATQIT